MTVCAMGKGDKKEKNDKKKRETPAEKKAREKEEKEQRLAREKEEREAMRACLLRLYPFIMFVRIRSRV